MLSFITSHTHIPKSQYPFSRLSCPHIPSLIFECNPKKRAKKFKKAVVLSGLFGFTEARRAWKFERNLDNSWCCWCKPSEGDVELEAEIMNFMAKSEKPTMFPTKKELMKAGRVDLVEAIEKRGGWYSLGWDEENVGDNVDESMDFDIGEFQRRVESYKESASLREHYYDSFLGYHKEAGLSSEENSNSHYDSFLGYPKEEGLSSEENSNSGNLDSLQLAAPASLGRSLEIGADEDTGIEGILSRLERQRNSDFGINLAKNRYEAHAKSKDEGDDMHFDTSLGFARTDRGENSRLTPNFHHNGILSTSSGKISPSTERETWRTWASRRAGFQRTDFEAAEISFSKNDVETDNETYDIGITVANEEYTEAWDKHKEISLDQIRTRLQYLESELTTTLRFLRSNREEVTGSSNDMQKLSDAWEFEENEFIRAQERLRSIRAKLAILEGKMALAITNAQNMVQLKQKRIDDAHKALQLLRTTSVVWPNSASEVLLAGSFDGWTTQRKMEKSKTGIFSVNLKLYPGTYEIKFIVDGVWKIDPLRPIVKNNGYDNNILLVS